jgi:hypothetical protein
MEHTYRGRHIRATAVLPAVSKRWIASIVISASNGTRMTFGHTVAASFATAADAEWEGVLHAMKWIDKDNRK